MSKKDTIVPAPRLSFPEFRDVGQWDIKLLGEISEIVRGGSPRPIEDFLTTDIDGLNWLKIGDVSPDSKYITNTEQKVIRDAISKTREVNPGDLILSNSMSFGRPYISNITSCIHDGWIAIRQLSKKIHKDYLYYIILSEGSQSYFLTNAAGAAVKNLNADIIKLLPVAFPSIAEQQKIADCLSSLDDLISAENEKLDALKAHKKGLMQQLFPAEGETVPKLRFPEFRDAGEWEETDLGALGKFIGGGTPSTSVEEYWDGDIQWFTPSEIKTRMLSKSKRTITEKGLQNSSAKLLPKGTLLLSTRATVGDVGIADNPCTTNQGFQSLIVNSSENNIFWYYWLVQHKNELLHRSSGSTFLEIGKNEIIKIPALRPVKKEQQKIADCLSSLDDLIKEQSEKIDNLKLHKKGLMQQLFPNTV